MAKQVTAEIKVQIPGGQATPAPPVGTALGPHGVNIGQFVQQFNDQTRELAGTTVPCIITVYNDRTFDFILKSPPAAVLLKQAAQIAKGAGNPRTDRVGSVTREPSNFQKAHVSYAYSRPQHAYSLGSGLHHRGCAD